MPSACAPSSIDSSPAIDASRGVRCGIVSSPTTRSIVAEAMSPLIRARARGLSLTSTTSTWPDSCSARASSSIACALPPRGGSISTETTNSPARNFRCRSVSRSGSLAEIDDLPLANDEPRARAAILVDGVPDRGDLGRRRSAAAADDPRAELARVRSELGEVVRRRVREDHALAGEAREADVRERGQRFAALAHPLDGTKRRLEAGAVVRADRGDVERSRALPPLARRRRPRASASPRRRSAARRSAAMTRRAPRRSRRGARRARRTSRS